MNVCIIGWYGTETIGDRAILAGILTLLSEVYGDVKVRLGSLYPFFSQRTVREDAGLWRQLSGRDVEVTLFDSTRPVELKAAIESSELLLFGGGPLMDLREMHMAAFAFCYARRCNVRTAVFGCGIGPLNRRSFQKAVADLLYHADTVLLRDRFSVDQARRLCPRGTVEPVAAVDPAAYCAFKYRETSGRAEPLPQVAVNLRRMPGRFGAPKEDACFEEFARQLIEKILTENEALRVVLVPNHYFFFGGDDRFFMNTLKFRINHPNLRVQNQPLSLSSTMDTFAASACCVGMRFHSVVLMSLLNGRCRILNYTGSGQGKTAGYLCAVDPAGYFDASRLLNLDTEELRLSIVDNLPDPDAFEAPADRLNADFETCRNVLRTVL